MDSYVYIPLINISTCNSYIILSIYVNSVFTVFHQILNDFQVTTFCHPHQNSSTILCINQCKDICTHYKECVYNHLKTHSTLCIDINNFTTVFNQILHYIQMAVVSSIHQSSLSHLNICAEQGGYQSFMY